MKILLAGDLHCGHLLGLTPPQYHNSNWPHADVMSNLWKWFDENLSKKYDVAVWNGDLVEGEGRHESSFHLTTDMNVQIEMAIDVVKHVGAKKNLFQYGSPYHAGQIMDYEKQIANYFNEDIKAIRKVTLAGVNFKFQHQIGKTTTPVGGDIMLRKGALWEMIYSVMDKRQPAQYCIFSHAHEYRRVENEHMTGIILPALKMGAPDYDRYARRMAGGFYSVGFLEAEIKNKQVEFKKHLFQYRISDEYEVYE